MTRWRDEVSGGSQISQISRMVVRRTKPQITVTLCLLCVNLRAGLPRSAESALSFFCSVYISLRLRRYLGAIYARQPARPHGPGGTAPARAIPQPAAIASDA